MTIRNLFNGMIEYSEGVFSAPYGSIVSLLLVGLPTSMRIDMCRFKHASEREMIGLKKAVKRQRYNGYLM